MNIKREKMINPKNEVMKSTCHNSPVKYYRNGCYCSVCFSEQFKPQNGIQVIFLGVFLLLVLASSTVKAPSINETISTNRFCGYFPGDIKPTDASVLEELVKNKCVLPSVAVAQARIESANYTSDMAVNNKNL